MLTAIVSRNICQSVIALYADPMPAHLVIDACYNADVRLPGFLFSIQVPTKSIVFCVVFTLQSPIAFPEKKTKRIQKRLSEEI